MKKSLKLAIAFFILIEVLGATVIWASAESRGSGFAGTLAFTHVLAVFAAVFVAGPLATYIDPR